MQSEFRFGAYTVLKEIRTDTYDHLVFVECALFRGAQQDLNWPINESFVHEFCYHVPTICVKRNFGFGRPRWNKPAERT